MARDRGAGESTRGIIAFRRPQVGRTKGAVLVARLRFVEERFGSDALGAIIAALPDDDRRTLEEIVLPAAWYPAELNARLDAAIIKHMGGDAKRAFWELGRQSADRNLDTMHRGFLRKKSPMRLLEQTTTIYRLYYDSGSRDFEATGETSGVIVTRGAEDPTEGDCLTVMGWHQRALEKCGARDVKVTHPECRARGGAVCRYALAWTLGP
jgi:uncharacterized protein (TIGR02265 family)